MSKSENLKEVKFNEVRPNHDFLLDGDEWCRKLKYSIVDDRGDELDFIDSGGELWGIRDVSTLVDVKENDEVGYVPDID